MTAVRRRERRVRLPVFLVEGGLVTDAQVRRLREKRMMAKMSVAAAGMNERTARWWRSGGLPSAVTAPRTSRTRDDPFAEAWKPELIPRLAAE